MGRSFHLHLPLRRPQQHLCPALTSRTTQLSFPVSLFFCLFVFFSCRRFFFLSLSSVLGRKHDVLGFFFFFFFGHGGEWRLRNPSWPLHRLHCSPAPPRPAPAPPTPPVFAVVVARTLTAVARIRHHHPTPLQPLPFGQCAAAGKRVVGERTFKIKQTEQAEASGFSAEPSGSFAPFTFFCLLVLLRVPFFFPSAPTVREGLSPSPRWTCSATALELYTRY